MTLRRGREALERARQSGEAACLDVGTGVQLVGEVRALHGDAEQLDLIELTGSCAVALDNEVVADWPRSEGYVLPLGRLAEDGVSLAELGSSGCAAIARLAADSRCACRMVSRFRVSL